MKSFLDKFITRTEKPDLSAKFTEEDHLNRQVAAIFSLLTNIYGSDKIVLKASKLEALNLIRSEVLQEKVLGLQRIVFEDPTLDIPPSLDQIPKILDEIQDEIADVIARRSVEDKLEKKIADRMQQRHEE